MAKASDGSLRPEEKQNLQLKKNELIRNSLLCIKNFDLAQDEFDSILRMLVSLTYHRVGAYLERLNDLQEDMLMIRGIYSNHVMKQKPATAQQTQQQLTQQPNAQQPQQNSFINLYNDWH